jgi:hypothetical protein
MKNHQIDVGYYDKVYCPHCDHIHEDLWDFNWPDGSEDSIKIYCHNPDCNKQFVITKFITVKFYSRIS